jgi:hypothetical protein
VPKIGFCSYGAWGKFKEGELGSQPDDIGNSKFIAKNDK